MSAQAVSLTDSIMNFNYIFYSHAKIFLIFRLQTLSSNFPHNIKRNGNGFKGSISFWHTQEHKP